MFKLVVLVSFAACALGAIVPKSSLPHLDGRIVGGEAASINQFPYQLSMTHIHGLYMCVATLYTPNIAIIYAGCVDGATPEELTIRAGSNYVRTGGVAVKVAKILFHPEHNVDNLKYDVALLKLETALPLGPTIKPIEIAEKSLPVGATAVVSGWEFNPNPLGQNSTLRFFNVNMVNKKSCASVYDYLDESLHPTMICAVAMVKGSCSGDNGAPLVANSKLIGINSWGVGCGNEVFTSIFTDVVQLKTWIDESASKL